jgi:hypothetical protein
VQLAVGHSRQQRIAEVEADVGPHPGGDARRLILGVDARHRFGHLRAVLLVSQQHQLEQQRLLRREVGVHRARLDARRLGQLSHRHAVEAPVTERLEGDLQQAAVRPVGRRPRREVIA